MWAVTTFFTPAGYRNRLRNFRVFRQHLPIPLLAVELSENTNTRLPKARLDSIANTSWSLAEVARENAVSRLNPVVDSAS